MGKQPGWMQGCATYKGAALALILDSHACGYEMTSALNTTLGLHLSPNALYPKLHKLEEDGLLYSVETEPAARVRGNKHTREYFPTELAPEAVMDWMSATSPFNVARREFYTKLAVARREHVPVLLPMVNLLEAQIQAEIKGIPGEEPFTTLGELQAQLVRTIELGRLNVELKALGIARRELREFL